MFATLAGGLPPPPLPRSGEPAANASADLADRLRLQVEAGLEPLTDGRGPRVADAGAPGAVVAAWRAAAEAVPDRLFKALLVGPYSAGLATGGSRRSRERATLAYADGVNAELRALAAAGCRIVQIDEPGAVAVGDRPAERRLFAAAQRRLASAVEGVHLCLAVTGGDAEATGAETLFELPYASYLFDLIAGPDNWRLIARAPTERGIICGVVPTTSQPAVVKEVMVWAAHYAASTNERGLDRVGLSTAGSLADLPWDVAVLRVRTLGEAARIAAVDAMEHLALELDPRAVGMKSAALGRNLPVPDGASPRRRPR